MQFTFTSLFCTFPINHTNRFGAKHNSLLQMAVDLCKIYHTSMTLEYSSGFILRAFSGKSESMYVCFMWFSITSQCNVYIHDTTTDLQQENNCNFQFNLYATNHMLHKTRQSEHL